MLPKLAFDPQAISTALCALFVNVRQEQWMFRNRIRGLEKLRHPGEYDQLKDFDIKERRLRASDAVRIQIWEKSADPALGNSAEFHHVLFHGNNGHVADAGPPVPGANNEGYDRHARINYLTGIAKTGAGFTGVSLRGYGKSGGNPSERGFKHDIKAVVNDLSKSKKLTKKIVVTGESLGTWSATQAAVQMTKLGKPPAALVLINPFASMAQVAEDFLNKLPLLEKRNVYLDSKMLDKFILRHHFNTAALFQELSPETTVILATSAKDELVSPANSDILEKIAKERGLKVVRRYFPNAGHTNVPVGELLKDMIGFCSTIPAPAEAIAGALEKPHVHSFRSAISQGGYFLRGLPEEAKGLSQKARDILLRRQQARGQDSPGL